MNEDNCFLLLGRTGVGKSTLTKILSENPNVVVGDSLKSQTQETECYNCEIDNFKYSLIDTPGYDDSNGNDDKNYGHIRKFLTSITYKIKGVVLMFSFQDPRFGDCHMKGLEKIVSLIPLKNFWEYITIIFTRTFSDDEDELQEEKEKKIKDFRGIFDVIISAFHKSKGIDIVPFDSIKKAFVNLKIKKTKKNELNSITSIIKNCAKLEPLFHKVDINENWKEILLLNDKESEIGDLINAKFKTYNYYNQKGEIIKKLSKPIQKEFIKRMSKKEYESSKVSGKYILVLAEIADIIPPLAMTIRSVYCLIKGLPLSLSWDPFIFSIYYKYINEKRIIEELDIDENF